MKIAFKLNGNSQNLMRQCGYYFERESGGELVFRRIIGKSKSGYPRFHIYLKTDPVSQQTQINLHLDQKKPIYKGVSAHAGEYDGKIVEEEAARIKSILGL